uniref:Transmembrane protein Vc569 n=1 Tax=Ciona intestinalis TaxID=7719 RepID=F6TYE2_CIOIN
MDLFCFCLWFSLVCFSFSGLAVAQSGRMFRSSCAMCAENEQCVQEPDGSVICLPEDFQCPSELCSDNGDCFPEGHEIRCECYPGWSGEFCEVNIEYLEHELPCGDCEPPCMPHEECIRRNGEAHCVERDIGCPGCEHGECLMVEGVRLICVCYEGWFGHHCEMNRNLIAHDCDPPCENGKKCVFNERSESDCVIFDEEDCSNELCSSHGVCDLTHLYPRCDCDEGWFGHHCERSKDNDDGHDGDGHKNNGDGHNGNGDGHNGNGDGHNGNGDGHNGNGDGHNGNGDGHNGNGDGHNGDGHNGNEGDNECHPPCEPPSRCVRGRGRRERGAPQCMQPPRGCESESCVNGRCMDTRYGFKCQCDEGWFGRRCEMQDTDESSGYPDKEKECHPPCRGHKRCMKIGSGPARCIKTGRSVEAVPQPTSCLQLPCKNEATCVSDLVTGFRCKCTNDYTGTLCDKPIPYSNTSVCYTKPCKNDCVCIPSLTHEMGYICRGGNGFIGKNCTIAIPILNCNKNEIQISISQQFYLEFDAKLRNSYMYISASISEQHDSNNICQGTLVNGSYIFKLNLPFNDCGTKQTYNTDLVSFTNKIWINRHLSGNFDMPVPVIQFTCIYSSEYSVVMSLQPVVNVSMQNITEYGNFEAVVNICRIKSCPSACPTQHSLNDGAAYTVGDQVHLSVSTTNITKAFIRNQTTITVKEMYLSCSRYQDSGSAIQLIHQGCSVGSGISMSVTTGNTNNSTVPACVSFQLPISSSSNCRTIFIHIRLLLCSNEQLQECSSGSGIMKCPSRRKRSINDAELDAVVGPISVIPGEQGGDILEVWEGDRFAPLGDVWSRNSRLYGVLDQSDPTEFGLQTEYVWFVVGIVSLSLFVVALLVAIIWRLCRRRCATANITPK